jgi:hypothetical protein
MKVTLDTNCIIDLEKKEGAVGNLKKLVAQHDLGNITVCTSAIGASERMEGGSYASNFLEFKDRLQKLSQRPFDILKPLCYIGVTYIDWCLVSGEILIRLEKNLHDILFPDVEFKWHDHALAHGLDPETGSRKRHKEWRKWLNCKCDVLGLWSHIHHKADIFVTRDGNFHKATKKSQLEALGAKRILEPSDLVATLGL